MARSKQIGRPIRQLGEPKTPPSPVTTYHLPIEEVQEKYGKPGVLACKMPYTRTERNLSPEEYEKQIRELAERLGL